MLCAGTPGGGVATAVYLASACPDTGAPTMLVRAAAAELPAVSLDDALHVCVLLRDREPERYERAAVRWIARFCVERREVSLEDVDEASRAFALMREDPERALLALQALCAGV